MINMKKKLFLNNGRNGPKKALKSPESDKECLKLTESARNMV